jgi:hypothetical protein
MYTEVGSYPDGLSYNSPASRHFVPGSEDTKLLLLKSFNAVKNIQNSQFYKIILALYLSPLSVPVRYMILACYFPGGRGGYPIFRSRDSSVCIALDYGLDDRGSRVPFPAGTENFSLHHRVQNGSGAHPASYPMGTRDSFPGNKTAGSWSWPLTSI